MEIGELVGTGRSADVYAIGGGRVLRRYRVPLDARREAEVMAYVAARGFPVPEVYPGESDATGLVMGRVRGPTMLRAAMDREIGYEEVGEILAGLLRRLHEIPARESADPGDRILHLDLHPDNVMLAPQGPVVIDWCNAREGAPALDCAMSALILAQVAVDPEYGPLMAGARSSLAALIAGLGDELETGAALDQARAIRGGNPTLSEWELGLLDEAVALIRRLRAE